VKIVTFEHGITGARVMQSEECYTFHSCTPEPPIMLVEVTFGSNYSKKIVAYLEMSPDEADELARRISANAKLIKDHNATSNAGE
jgi:hypothetical protein